MRPDGIPLLPKARETTGLPIIAEALDEDDARLLAAHVDGFLVGARSMHHSAGGNENVILCERGIRTFVIETRNTLDISAVPAIREKTDLPIIVAPSHASGRRKWVLPPASARSSRTV